MNRRRFLGVGLGIATASGISSLESGRSGTQSDAEIDVEQIVADSYDEPGLATGIADSGERILFGFDDGNVMVHDDNGSEVIPHPVNQAVSHILVRDAAETAVVAWMDAGAFSLLNLAETDGPYVEHPGLWDLDMTPEAEFTVSASYPLANPGTLQAVDRDGESLWETPVDDAAGFSVAVTDDADRVALGAVEYWENGVEAAGTPGVRFYDDEGGELWRHDLDVGVVDVGIDADRELVVAGTDEGRAIVLDFAGEVRRDTAAVGWVALSDDGSTIVTAGPDGLAAVDSETGDERWSTDVRSTVTGDISVAADGGRVLAANRRDAEFALVDEGDVVWTASYEVGPVMGALAADGRTWSTIVTDDEAGASEVAAYWDSDTEKGSGGGG